MKSKTLGTMMIFCGIVSILAAVLLIYRNYLEANHADQASQVTVAILGNAVPRENNESLPSSLEEAAELTERPNLEEIPPYILNPDIEMPEKKVDGIAYIGILEIPDLKIELPIASRWDLSIAKKAPCRYQGSVYQNNMVIAGHNYQKHFGKLSSLPLGSQLRFSDLEGNMFTYEIHDFEKIQATAIDEMCYGEWDLTLFTCTTGGHARIAVRCRRVETEIS